MKIYVTIAGERENGNLFESLIDNSPYQGEWHPIADCLVFIEEEGNAEEAIEDFEEIADNAGLLIWCDIDE